MKPSSGRSVFYFCLLFVCAGILTACGGGGGGGSSSSVSNVAPVANNDVGTVSEGGTTNINAAANDTDAEGALDLASISVVNDPSNGSPVVNADGTIDYQHDGSTTATDSFTYTIADTSGATSNVATVNVTVMLDGAPVAGNIAETLAEGGTISLDISANVTEGDNALDLSSITIVSGPNSGSVVDNRDGSVDYTHDGSETTTDSFSYTIADTSGVPSNVATVSLTITLANDAPTISGTPASVVGEGGFYSFVPTAADADPNDTLIFSISTRPAWASFDAATGALTGSPSSSDVGKTTTGLVITVDDQQEEPNSTASLPAFDLSVTEGFNEALFATPEVSSSNTVESKFQANDGDPATTWVADSADSSVPGPSIQLNFDTAKLIYRVDLSDLPTGGQLTAGLMEFSDGSSETITALPDNGTPTEFVFEPRQSSWVKITLTQTTGASGLAEIAAYSALDPDQTEISRDLFNDGNAAGWTVTDNCLKSGTSSNWGVGIGSVGVSPEAYTPEAYQQTGNCRGYSPEGVEMGSYSVYSVPAAAGMDLRLRVRSDDVIGTNWDYWAIGVLFGYGDDENYYRLDISGMEGHRKLWKRQAGAFSELNTSPQSYTLGQWVNLRVVQSNGVILVYLDGEKIMALEDASLSAGQIALFCARNESCSFDNVFILDPPGAPIVGLNIADGSGHRSGEYFVSTGGTLDVAATLTDGTGIGGVEFVVDEGLAAELSKTAIALPYSAQFNFFTTAGNHDVRAYLLDGSLQRLAGSGAVDELPQLGVNGIHLASLGDSITSGLKDDDPVDDISADGRNTGRGYQSVLNNLLTADNGSKPVTVLDEGNPGETSGEAATATRIGAVLNRTPAAQAYLAIYGANDSGDGITKAQFKSNMQQIIDAVTGAGKMIYLAKAPPYLGATPGRDALIQAYNDAIQELVNDPANGFSGYTPPDFHTFFTNTPQQMADDLHPNGIGYRSMARMWCESLNGQAGMVCSP